MDDKKVRRFEHDIEQARRRTDKQNQALVDLLLREDEMGMWGYDDIPPEGGPLTVVHPDSRRQWLIDTEGNVEIGL